MLRVDSLVSALRRNLAGAGLVAGAAAAGLMVGTPGGVRVALALPVAVLIVVFALRAPRAVLVLSLIHI